MTVCIAAIYNGTSIVGASDRLLTAGDMQFQPNSAKVVPLTNSIVAMTAGDAWLHSEIMSSLGRSIGAAIKSNSEIWLEVRWVAEWYVEHWNSIRRQRAEQQILKPFGLTTDEFMARQASFSEKWIQDISAALLSFKLPAAHCIIAGVDPTGPHLFAVYDGSLTQADTAGFAAIGSGSRHAESQLMLAKYTPTTAVGAAVPLVHLAKSRAEVAPGVGTEIDMFIVGPNLGSYVPLATEIVDYLQRQAESLRADEEHALRRAEVEMNDFIQGLPSMPDESQEAAPEEERGADEGAVDNK